MKYVILILILFFILFVYRLVQIKSQSLRKKQKSEEKTIDLEKDPKTDEYKPKE